MQHIIQPRKANRQALCNVTDGVVNVHFDASDLVPFEQAVQTTDTSLQYLQDEPKDQRIRCFIQDLRTGQFHQKAEKYILKLQQQEEFIRSDLFQNQLRNIVNEMTSFIYKFVFYFQGILAGALIFQLLIINFSGNSFSNIFRLDQIIRAASTIACFGSAYNLRSAYNKSVQSQSRQVSTAAQDRKFYLISIVSAVFFGLCYLLVVIQHAQTLKVSTGTVSSLWNPLGVLMTVFANIGWFFAVFNSKHSLQRQYLDSAQQ